MRPLRWVTRTLGVIVFAIYAFLVLTFGQGRLEVGGWVLAGAIIVGLLLAIFWTGIGEVVGGLALVGGAVAIAFQGGLETGALTAGAPFALVGVLFIACGWYTQAQRSRRATPTIA